MRHTIIYLLILFIANSAARSQGNKMDLPYHQIPDYPETFTTGNVIGRMIDGLGYRYYWATEGLRKEDLSFKPSEDARSMGETLDHLYGLSITIVNAPGKQANIRSADWSGLTYEQKRRKTLENFQKTSDLVKGSQESDFEEYNVVFIRGENTTEFPFWNMLNGPIADAIYHVGQIVSFRRSSGNPMHPRVNVFIGKTRE